MKSFNSILLPFDRSDVSIQAIDCAAWLTSTLDATLHVLSVLDEPLPEKDVLSRLGFARELQPRVTLHQTVGDPGLEILNAVKRYAIDLIVIAARGQSLGVLSKAENTGGPKLVGHVTRAVIEGSPVPALLLPPQYQGGEPWNRALVPLSGEPRPDEALTVAIRLANALDLKLAIVHVAEPKSGESVTQCYYDAAHHEYPQMLEHFIARACPLCSAEDRRCIEGFSIHQGDIKEEMLKAMEECDINLLVVGWHGAFVGGRAQILKGLIEVLTCPLLLVKAGAEPHFKLKVGPDLDLK